MAVVNTRRAAALALILGLLLASVAHLGCGGEARRPSALVLGLDGATWKLLTPLMDKGELPHLKSLVDSGISGNLSSVVPFLSPPAWTSAITGVNPGKHGIFDFLRRLPNQMMFVNESASSRRVPPIWMLLSEAGFKVGVINVPATDPPDAVNGFMISGLPHKSVTGYTYPPELEKELKGYRLEKLQISLEANHEGELLSEIQATMRARAATTEKLITERDWDFAWIVFTETDRVQHFYWQFMDPDWPGYNPELAARYGGAIHDVWVELDQHLGRILAAARKKKGADLPVLVLSDHGFGPVHRELRLQSLLRHPPAGQTPITSSYSPETNGSLLYFMKQGREPTGNLDGAAFDATRAAVVARVQAERDPVTGGPAARWVFKREDVYRGRFSEKSPDVVMIPAPGVYISNDRGEREPWGPPSFTFSGHHEMEGILIASGGPFRAGRLEAGTRGVSLLDITPTLLYLLGRPVPDYCDGRALSVLFDPGFVKKHPVKSEGRALPSAGPADTAGDAAAVKGVPYLEGLPYIK